MTEYFHICAGIVLQGECEDELPERMLACVVINKVDCDQSKKLYDRKGSREKS